MNLKIIALSLLFSAASFGQCVKCNNWSEAEKDPEKVISLIINPVKSDELPEEIPANIAAFVNVEELFLTDLSLKSIPKEIGKLTKLKSLSLAGNELETLPEELFELKNLKELILFSNAFSEDYAAQLRKNVKEKLPGTKLMMD